MEFEKTSSMVSAPCAAALPTKSAPAAIARVPAQNARRSTAFWDNMGKTPVGGGIVAIAAPSASTAQR